MLVAMLALTEQRRFRYYTGLFIFTAIALALICAGTYFFWQYIGAYEASRQEHTILSLQENIDYDFWENKAIEALESRLTEFEASAAVAIEPHLSKIRDVRYTFRNNSEESTENAPAYTVRAGAQDIGLVRLAKKESLGYGFYSWSVGSIELLDSFVDSLSRSISITASQNARVELGGVAVSETYRVDCEFEYGATYLIEGIFGEVEIFVFESDGSETDPYFAENGVYLYPIIPPVEGKYNLVVPQGFDVYADGNMVSSEYITENSIIPALFEGIFTAETTPHKMKRYEFALEWLGAEPVITVSDAQGTELEATTELGATFAQGGEVVYKLPFSDELKEQNEARVEEFIRAYVNYGSNIGNDAQANLTTVNKYVYRNSDLYSRLQSSLHGLDWVGETSVEYESLEIDNFTSYGDKYFSCEVRYRLTNRTRYEARKVEGDYELLFIVAEGSCYVMNMLAIS